MVQKINNYSEKDIKKIVKNEVSKKFHAYDIMLNHLKGRIIDLEKVERRGK
jgi:hypothetical protein